VQQQSSTNVTVRWWEGWRRDGGRGMGKGRIEGWRKRDVDGEEGE
jgi:hypothetical protein